METKMNDSTGNEQATSADIPGYPEGSPQELIVDLFNSGFDLPGALPVGSSSGDLQNNNLEE